MKKVTKPISELALILLVPQLAMAQRAEGKIGQAGSNDHADWKLELRPLRQ
ncbi:MAG: hypothetical protein ACR2QT_10885 [Woeseiaceae bacterium]